MITYKRHSGRKHEHQPQGSSRAIVHSHLGGGTKHSHGPVSDSPVFEQPPFDSLVPGVITSGLEPWLADDRVALSPKERSAIALLQYLGRHWPRSLKLISMDGSLHVVRTGDPRFEGEGRSRQERQEVIIADIDGIPNDGGSW